MPGNIRSRRLADTSDTRLVANTIQSARFGIEIGGDAPNVDLQVIDYMFGNPFGGTWRKGSSSARVPLTKRPPRAHSTLRISTS